MGKNGSGKSTLAQVLAGRETYEVTDGTVAYDGKDLLELSAEERAREGVFLAFQYPVEIPGVSTSYFLKAAVNAVRKHRGQPEMDTVAFLKLVKEKMALLKMDQSFMNRAVNEGFSGGEKKRNEIFQMAVCDPRLALMDETDSGLDIDALKVVANGANSLRRAGPGDPDRDALSAAAELHRAGFRSRHAGRADREDRRQEPGDGAWKSAGTIGLNARWPREFENDATGKRKTFEHAPGGRPRGGRGCKRCGERRGPLRLGGISHYRRRRVAAHQRIADRQDPLRRRRGAHRRRRGRAGAAIELWDRCGGGIGVRQRALRPVAVSGGKTAARRNRRHDRASAGER